MVVSVMVPSWEMPVDVGVTFYSSSRVHRWPVGQASQPL